MADLRDLWGECYAGEARAMPPEQFKQTFCGVCQNGGCKNSRAAGTLWSKRMATQVEDLLNNPKFADMDDPMFREIRALDFQDKVREALAIEVNSRKGDWSIPTEAEVVQLAAELTGAAPPPSFFQPSAFNAPEPEPPRPATPEPLPTLPNTPAPLPPEPARVPNQVPPPDPNDGAWEVRGDTPNSRYTVKRTQGVWSCSCPAFSYHQGCKHVLDVSVRLSRAPVVTPPPSPNMVQDNKNLRAPDPTAWTQAFALRGVPTMQNTAVPAAGVMVGGIAPAPAPAPADPWAAPAPPPTRTVNEFVIPVGGKVVMGATGTPPNGTKK